MSTLRLLCAGILIGLVFGCSTSVSTDPGTNPNPTKHVLPPDGGNSSAGAPDPTALPTTMDVTASFNPRPTPQIFLDDNGKEFASLRGSVVNVVFSTDVHDQLTLEQASSREFLSPLLGTCTLNDFVFSSLGGDRTVDIEMDGEDAPGATACQDFVSAVAQNGLKMKFSGVPLLNGGTINEVTIEISSPVPAPSNPSPATTGNPTPCSVGCDRPPKCQDFAKQQETELFPADASKFTLWTVSLITANPHPGNYQVENYAFGTQPTGGHSIWVSYGYEDTNNPGGACRLEMVDGKAAVPNPAPQS